MYKTVFSSIALFLAASLAGCSSDTTSTTGGSSASTSGGSTSGDMQAPDFPGGGQTAHANVAYPAGPYGLKKGSIIANYDFIGFADSMKVSNALQGISLADFYNPTGKDVYPEGSPHGAGQPKPKVLLLDVPSVWCPPCNYEAGTILPPLHTKYKPKGGEFMEVLADGPTPGTAATQKNLFSWTKKYKIDYPTVIDPEYKLGPLFAQDAFPANLMIDTRTMKICDVIAGAPDPTDTSPGGGAAWWAKYDAVIADSAACK